MRQSQIDFLLAEGVPPSAMMHPDIIGVAHGIRATDGIFEPTEDGPLWFSFREKDDTVLWCPRSGEIATECGTAFALGAEDIRNPWVTALDSCLYIHADPLAWLRSNRRGIVVIRWQWAFEQLRDVSRIVVHEDVLGHYRKYMAPRKPRLWIVPRSDTMQRATA